MTPQIALDANAYRALDDGSTRLAEAIRTTARIGIPITVLGELYFGIYAGSRPKDNLSNLSRFLMLPRVELLQIDEQTAKIFGEIATELKRMGRPIQQDDMWIAALCKQYNFILATADRDFEAVTGLELLHF